MKLSKENLRKINLKDIHNPDVQLFDLPDKVIQFGTGILLRGLPDYFIDKANKLGLFNGRVIVIKSTNVGDTIAYKSQDGLFTQLVKGIEDGEVIDETIINSSINCVLSASEDWNEILNCAADPNINLIISNTTELGIRLFQEDKVDDYPPSSFPGKLLSLLWKRYNIFKGSSEYGFIIIPTELIVDNGKKLKAIVVELAKLNGLSESFLQWLISANDFCDSLVDRIVPGRLNDAEKIEVNKNLGYEDDLMIMSESYRLWAIESSYNKTIDYLTPLCKADKGIIVVPDIQKYRELKLRLLNGAHTFSCGLAILAGFETVKEAMQNKDFKNFITILLMDEISPSIINHEITLAEARSFASQVLDRFQNPYLDHKWLAISAQYTSKMKMRNIPTIIDSFKKGVSSNLMAASFACYILFMRSELNENGQYFGHSNSKKFLITDEYAGSLFKKWKENSSETITYAVLKDETLWNTDLSKLEGFAGLVKTHLQSMMKEGLLQYISNFYPHNNFLE